MITGTIKCNGCGAIREISGLNLLTVEIGTDVTVGQGCPDCGSKAGNLQSRRVRLYKVPETESEPGAPETTIVIPNEPSEMNFYEAIKRFENGTTNSVNLPVPELELDDDDQIARLKRMYEESDS